MKYPVNGSILRPSQEQTAQTAFVPAPAQGINAISNLAQMQPDEAVYSFNMVPSQYGMKVRDGYSEFATNVGTGGVKTVIPFVAHTTAGDKLFAAANSGIYDVSAGGVAPTLKLAWGTVDSLSGYGSWVTFTNLTGDKFCLLCDETNGYKLYTQTTDTWSTIVAGVGAGQINGTDPANFAFCMIWKSRVWFIKRGSSSAWYLPVGSITGTVTEFNFGNKFKYGGTLVALFNWTVDGGEGIDDYLVAISSAGDVVVYKGTDPSDATKFDQRGTFYIGPPPAGRRIAGTFGGELYLLSVYGLIPISKLMSGQPIIGTDVYVSRKITPLINTQMRLSRQNIGWEVKLLPTQNLLMVSTPKQLGFSYIQFVQSLDTRGWALYRDFPFDTGDTWLGDFYIGTSDNRIMKHTGSLDNLLLSDPNSGVKIEFSLLTVYLDYNLVGGNKVAQFIRPTFIAEAVPSYSIQARYDYNLLELIATAPATSPTGDVWDVGVWDTALWGGEVNTFNTLSGGSGMGRAVGVALRGQSNAKTTLIRIDLTMTAGNVL